MSYQPEVRTTTLTLEGVGGVDVSTCDLDYLGQNTFGYQPETCLFWGNESNVVETYSSWPEAIQGHVRWTDPATVARAIAEYTRMWQEDSE